MTTDHFERLGVPRRFSVDRAEVERQYLVRSREVHPDFHHQDGGVRKAASVEVSAALNEAYATLMDPFCRAEYLLQSAGGPTAADVRDIPIEFLDEMLDLRMEIGGLRPESPAAIAMENQLVDRRDALLTQVGDRFDGLTTENRVGRLREARQLLNATKYVRNLLRDLRAL